jgi:transglutaminase/protease-like cytokinesis protein 3
MRSFVYYALVNANANPGTESQTNARQAPAVSDDTRIRTIVVADRTGADAYANRAVGSDRSETTNARTEVNHMATAKSYTPKELANELGIDPKILRGYLRKEFARTPEAKNTAWVIPATVANAARKHFAKNVAGSAKS